MRPVFRRPLPLPGFSQVLPSRQRRLNCAPSKIAIPKDRFGFHRSWQPTVEAPMFVTLEELPVWQREYCLNDQQKSKLRALVEKTKVTRAALSGLMRMIEDKDFFLFDLFSPDSNGKTKNLEPLHFYREGLVVENILGRVFISAQIERAQFLDHVGFSGATPKSDVSGIFSVLPPFIDRLFFFDTETNGTNAKAGDEPIELAWHVVNRDGVIEESATHLLRKPGIVIPKGAMNVHELTCDMLMQQGEDPREVYVHFLKSLNGENQNTLPIGHKSPFDVLMINYDLLRYGLGQIPDMHGLDTLTMVKMLFPQLLPKSGQTPDGYKLKLAASFFDPDQNHLQFHHAADDNLAVAFLLEQMVAHAVKQGLPAKALVDLSMFETGSYLVTPDPSSRQKHLPTTFLSRPASMVESNEFVNDLIDKVEGHFDSENPRAFLTCANPLDRNVGLGLVQRALAKGQRVLWLEPSQGSLENSYEALKILAGGEGVERLDGKRFASHEREKKQEERLEVWRNSKVLVTSAGLLAASLRAIKNDYSRVPFGDFPEQTYPLQDFDVVILGHFRDYLYRPLVPIFSAYRNLKVLSLCAAPGSDPLTLRDTLREFGMEQGVIEPDFLLQGAPKAPPTIFRAEPVPSVPTLEIEESFERFFGLLLEPFLRHGVWAEFIRQKSTEQTKEVKRLGLDRQGICDSYLAFFANLKTALENEKGIEPGDIRNIFEPLLTTRLKPTAIAGVIADLQSEILCGSPVDSEKKIRLLAIASRKVSGLVQIGFVDFLRDAIQKKRFPSRVPVRGFSYSMFSTFPLTLMMRMLFGERLVKAGYLDEAKNYLAPLYGVEFTRRGARRIPNQKFMARFLDEHPLGRKIFSDLQDQSESNKDYRRHYLIKQIAKIISEGKPQKIVVYLETYESIKIYREVLEECFPGAIAVYDSKHSIANQRQSYEAKHSKQADIEILLSTSTVFSRKIFPADYGFILKPLTEPEKLQQILDKVSLRVEMLYDVTQSGSLKRSQSKLHRQEEIIADPQALTDGSSL